jgi:hypothetical protein
MRSKAVRFRGSITGEHFNGPISISLDEEGNIFVGDRFYHVVRMIYRKTGIIETIAGKRMNIEERIKDTRKTKSFRLSLPQISSMDYHNVVKPISVR